MAQDARCLADQRIFVVLIQINAIVGNQTVSFLDQFQSRFRLPDAAVPGYHDAHPENINENPVHRNPFRQFAFKEVGDVAGYSCRSGLRRKDRNAGFLRGFHQFSRGRKPAPDDEARRFFTAKTPHHDQPLFGGNPFDECKFRFPQQLDAGRRVKVKKSGQLNAGSGDFAGRDLVSQKFFSAQYNIT